MSSLIVVCSQCLTWVEPHADRCTECGVAVDIDASDPDDEVLVQRLGEPLLELGPVYLDRHSWPSLGWLVATTEGLLFLPDFAQRPNGAIEPRIEEPDSSTNWTARLGCSWWWPQQSQFTPTLPISAADSDDAVSRPMFQRLLNAPGGLFVARASIHRLLARWNHLQIERRPARSVTLRPVPRGASAGALLRQLRGLSAWRGV